MPLTQIITAPSVASAAIFGTHAISNSALTIAPSGITSAASYGTHTISNVTLYIVASSVAEAATVSSPRFILPGKLGVIASKFVIAPCLSSSVASSSYAVVRAAEYDVEIVIA